MLSSRREGLKAPAGERGRKQEREQKRQDCRHTIETKSEDGKLRSLPKLLSRARRSLSALCHLSPYSAIEFPQSVVSKRTEKLFVVTRTRIPRSPFFFFFFLAAAPFCFFFFSSGETFFLPQLTSSSAAASSLKQPNLRRRLGPIHQAGLAPGDLLLPFRVRSQLRQPLVGGRRRV